jgi:hypothetical protein
VSADIGGRAPRDTLPLVDVASSNLVIRSESFRAAKLRGKTSETPAQSAWRSDRATSATRRPGHLDEAKAPRASQFHHVMQVSLGFPWRAHHEKCRFACFT